MVKRFVNTIISRLFFQHLPTRDNAFGVQKHVLQSLLSSYKDSPLYTNIGLKQDQKFDLLACNEDELRMWVAQYPYISYKEHILPLVESDNGITDEKYDLLLKTSGTSDANQGGKLIPTSLLSFANERLGVQRTLSCYLREHLSARIFFTTAFALTAPFDSVKKIGYVSGAMKYVNTFYTYMVFPSDKILSIVDWYTKKQTIVDLLLHKTIRLGSFHGVPTRSLDIIYELIRQDPQKTKDILQQTEYISIGGGAPLDYKEQFARILRSLGLTQKLYASNNHNASEGFLGAQVRCFDDLQYHWMSPMMQTNFFIFIPVSIFDDYTHSLVSYQDMIMKSSWLHEVVSGQEYMMLFANHRIPRLYHIKDKVVFKQQDDLDTVIEYIVTGRYGMASNVFNEHIELTHIFSVMDRISSLGYHLDNNNLVAGMQLIDNTGIFHIIVESMSIGYDISTVTSLIDRYMGEINDQWKSFREREKIIELKIVIVPPRYIRDNLILLGKMHEQSKIPHLSDHNYEHIVKPLLHTIKK